MKKGLTAFIALFAIALSLSAQVKKATVLTKNPALYERVDIDINLVAKWENPYLQEDVALDMYITSPSGKQLVLPCYYESGKSGEKSLWKARFTPQETGKYSYNLKIRKGDNVLSTSKAYAFKVAPSDKKGILHPKDFWVFQYDNGQPFRGVAENICWESRASDDSKFFKELHEQSKYNYDYMLTEFAKNGGNFFRTWMCSWNLPIDWKKGFNNRRYTPSDEYYNPSALARMDHMINLCDSLDLHIMLTLGQGASGVREGGFATSSADFFVNPKAKERYKNRLRYIVARWGYSPAIGAWEFFNEVDNVQFNNRPNPIKAQDIVDWHDEMSTYLKQLDPYGHITTTSISHRDIEGLNSLPNIDVNQKHIYKHTSSIPSEILKYEKNFGKPYVIGEFSYEWDWGKNFDDFAEDMDIDFKRGLWYGLFSPTPVLPMSWWWEFFDARGMTAYYRGVRDINDKMLAAGNGSFVTLPIEASNLDAFCVQCGDQIFVYLYNDTVSNMQTDMTIKGGNGKAYKAQRFTPTTLKYEDCPSVQSSAAGISLKGGLIGSKEEAVFLLIPKK